MEQHNRPHRPIRLAPVGSYRRRYREIASRYRRYFAGASIVPIIVAALVFGGNLGAGEQPNGLVAFTTGQSTIALANPVVWAAGETRDAPAPNSAALADISGRAEKGAPAPAAEATPTPVPTSPFVEYEVVEGDTLSSVAAGHGVGLEDILWNNPVAAYDPDTVLIGDRLVVPTAPGIVYYVEIGDTLVDIAARYGIDPEAIVAYEGNNIASADLIVEGAPLLLPGAAPLIPEVVEEPVLEVPETPAPPPPAPTPVPTAVPEPRPSAPVPASVGGGPVEIFTGFIWPVNGPINSYFGPRWGGFHTGIDIGAATGTPVGAAAGGQVVLTVYSGAGYGNHVVIRHADGSQTLYAHLSEIWVSNGQQVSQGDAIGAVGCTGWCTGSHLHFEVKINGVQVDPLLYLP